MHTKDDGGNDADREDTTPDVRGESAHTLDEGTKDGANAKKKRKKKGGAGAAPTSEQTRYNLRSRIKDF